MNRSIRIWLDDMGPWIGMERTKDSWGTPYSSPQPRLERHPDGKVQLVVDLYSEAVAEDLAAYMGIKILCSPCADVAAQMDRLEAQLRGKVL